MDRDRLIQEGFAGHASPLAGFTQHFAAGVPAGLAPYPHQPARARELLQAAGWPAGRPLRLAATSAMVELARRLAEDYEGALGLDVEVIVPPAEQVPAPTRQLVEKRLPLPWDLHLHAWIDLSADAPPAMLHREFIAATGAFRTGPPVAEFDHLFERYAGEIDPTRFSAVAEEMDQVCYDQALAVFLCSPKALYAVNRHVRFVATVRPSNWPKPRWTKVTGRARVRIEPIEALHELSRTPRLSERQATASISASV